MIARDEQAQRREKCPPRNTGDTRTPWERDFARIVHSAAFRRLQSKTQIFGLGDSDFYRTRLTHSLEVAQIAAAITINLKRRDKITIKNFLPHPQLISTVGLAHDLGHPPFGHGGEVALNYCMRNYGGFEGNGQTLRILSYLEKYSVKYGLNPTRRLMLGVLKYPVSYETLVSKELQAVMDGYKHTDSWLIKKGNCKPPKCYLDSEKKVVDWILSPFYESDRRLFTAHTAAAEKHGKSLHKSLDASIMELADDVSYGVHDLEDAITLKLITESKFRKIVQTEHPDLDIDELFMKCGAEKSFLRTLFSKNAQKRKHQIGALVNMFIIHAQVEDKNERCKIDFHDEILRYNVELRGNYKKLNDILLLAVRKCVIEHPNVQLMELKGQKIVCKIFEVLSSDPERFLHGSTKKEYLKQDNGISKMRIICDYIAGMTDEYATKLYEKLFCTRKGSIFDHL